MIIYHFNLEDGSLRKMKVIKTRPWNGWYIRAYIDRSTDCRKDKYKDWITVSINEGEVHYNAFYLEKEDDIRAKEIFDNYRAEQRKKKQEQFNKMKEKWGF